jgi:hypothetical protein
VENLEEYGTTVTPALGREAGLQSILNESGQRLGEVWVQGTLGGVPGSDTAVDDENPSGEKGKK